MKHVTRVISFTSGKGGVGKTSSVINTAIALARTGRSVLLMDADLGLANIDVMLGVEPKYTLQDLFEGTRSIEEIMITGPEGISIIPASSGVEWMCTLRPQQRLLLIEQIERIAGNFDYLLIDTAAGIGPEVMYFNSASTEIVCVVTGEPTSLTDAYALIKVLSRNYGEKNISVLANNVPDERAGRKAFGKLEAAVERFLHVQLRYLGHVPTDRAVTDALIQQRAVIDIYPSSAAGRAFANVGGTIDAEFLNFRVKGGMQFFFQQLLEVSAHGG